MRSILTESRGRWRNERHRLDHRRNREGKGWVIAARFTSSPLRRSRNLVKVNCAAIALRAFEKRAFRERARGACTDGPISIRPICVGGTGRHCFLIKSENANGASAQAVRVSQGARSRAVAAPVHNAPCRVRVSRWTIQDLGRWSVTRLRETIGIIA